MQKKIKFTEEKPLTIEGFVTIQKKDDGLHTADFQCCEDVQIEPVKGDFKVQLMRDGNIYMDEKPKRKRNKPIFRQDHSSLSLGKDGIYYFTFRLPQEEVFRLAGTLKREAEEVAKKIITMLD
jgi:hypothetical protein